jgi:hypothetical protein
MLAVRAVIRPSSACALATSVPPRAIRVRDLWTAARQRCLKVLQSILI